MLSSSSGKLLSTVSADSPDQRTALSFRRHVTSSRDRIEPGGVGEMMSHDALLVVTDLNRLLYIDVSSSRQQQLQAAVTIPRKTNLTAVAVTNDNKLVLTEVRMR